MRTTLTALSLAAGLGVIACQSAAALPVAAEAIQQAATALQTLNRRKMPNAATRNHYK